ncbi:hypothetical protein OHA74_23170 [Streptomyces phaeochromogenes]|uniref:hypothetical protein n=1 Tax=Streptomyces phaeochromogenes TaxID=1923 RepID=UPI002E286A34|nr:hypothetical protein [Streptomyces phaeochromogenes]MCX4560912.1 hypothetical protein [Streptomyces phaeochromogenes]
MSQSGGGPDETGEQPSRIGGRASQEGVSAELAELATFLTLIMLGADRNSDDTLDRIARLRNRQTWNLKPISPNVRAYLTHRPPGGLHRDIAALAADRHEISNDFLQALVKILLQERPDILQSALVEFLESGDGRVSDLAIFANLARATAEHHTAQLEVERQAVALAEAQARRDRSARQLEQAQRRANQNKRQLERDRRKANDASKSQPTSQDD